MINDKDYWEDRFSSNDWESKGGGEQSSFFCNIALENLPMWLIKEIEIKRYSILDLGCAQGECTNLLKNNFPNSILTGIDFSKSAIDLAKETYNDCIFECKGIEDVDNSYDLVLCSNVLEHFRNPFNILNKVFDITKKYSIILLPFQEENLHPEHFCRFDFSDFLVTNGHFNLCYYKIIDCRKMNDTMWPGKQIMIVYANDNHLSKDLITLAHLNNYDFEYSSFILNEKNRIEKSFTSYKEAVKKEIKELNEYKEAAKKEIKELNEYKESVGIELLNLNNEIEAKNTEILESKISRDNITNKIKEIESLCDNLSSSKIAKFSHFITRVKWQFIKGSSTEKKLFLKWIISRLRGEANFDRRYNYLYIIKNALSEVYLNNTNMDHSVDNTQNSNELFEPGIDKMAYRNQDIIVLSVIDWDFRYQRPQHIAEKLSKQGHRVFYFNSDFKAKQSAIKISDNLFVITLKNENSERIYDIDFRENVTEMENSFRYITDWYNIRDCTVIVEYPTWSDAAEYLNKYNNFNIVFDYIDDYFGFEDTATIHLKEKTYRMFEISDAVIATSKFLYDKAKQYSNSVHIVRNGTEFDFFNRALNKNETQKIGYYGAIAEWFDVEKVAYLAENLPEYQIELIGNVSCDKCLKLNKYQNVTFLGEKPYKELVNYLKEYKVCLIPFRSDIDLIKATNPVKFYEYLSAGKKIVATEIPELEPFRDKYVYLAKDEKQFLHYVELCLTNNDELASEEAMTKFALNNDWNSRGFEIDRIIKATYPLVSIIIVTYNNLEYTKMCINSILEKTAYPNYEIIIIDNASVDDTPSYLSYLESEHKNIKIKLNVSNRGFAGGNNDGISISNGEYIILLNNDTVVTRGWVSNLIKHLKKEDIGMVCPVTNSIGNEAKINVDYTTLEEMDKFAIKYTTLNFNKTYDDINSLAMFCVAFTRDAFNEVGYLDENYKVGMFEDDDYSTAMIKKGYRIVCVEDVFIHHFGSVSFKCLEDKEYKDIFENNKKYFEEKWNIVWKPHKYRKL